MHQLEPAAGWQFHREPDGSVTVTGTGSVTLDPDAWAATVAVVSARGETGDTVRNAQAFHMMQPRRMESV